MAATNTLPASHRALVCHGKGQPLELSTRPTPQPTSGTAVIRVLTSSVVSYAGDVMSGKRNYPYPTPFIPGTSAVGRVVAVGPDAALLKPGDLVLTDIVIRGRDDPSALAMVAAHQGGTAGSLKLVQGEFRDGSYAEYAKVALENLLKLPESPSYTPAQWVFLARALIPFGGLTTDGGLDLHSGETIVIAPATGQFGGAAVEVALAMGARVVALGRNEDALRRLELGLSDYGDRLRTVQMKNDPELDIPAIGPVDCFFDISPPMAAKSTHIMSCFSALKPHGRAVLMGGIKESISIPTHRVVHLGISIVGKWMYETTAPRKLLQLVETGLLRLDRQTAHAFPLEQWKEAFGDAAERMRWDELTCIEP